MQPTPIPPLPAPVVVAGPAPVAGRYTLDQYLALKAVLATGAREIQYGDQRVSYQTPNQIRQTLAEMAAELGLITSRRRVTPGFSKGLL